MTRTLVIAGFMAWIGLSLVLARLPFFQQPSLLRRLRPYTPGATNKRARVADARSFRDVVGPLSQSIGTQIAKIFGVHEEVRVRLERVHAVETSSEFRVRQVAWSLGALIFVVGVSVTIGLPILFVLLLLLGAPLLVFLMIEQQLANRSDRWQARLNLELPVVAEQMAMLLTAGFSLGGALGRLSSRTQGAVATDLRRVLVRVRQGIPESEALTEWATLAKVASVDRLVAVLRAGKGGNYAEEAVPAEFRKIAGSPRNSEADAWQGFRYDQDFEFIEAIHLHRACRPSFIDGLRVQEVMAAIQTSAVEHRAVGLEAHARV